MNALGTATFVKETSITGGLASRAGHPHTAGSPPGGTGAVVGEQSGQSQWGGQDVP